MIKQLILIPIFLQLSLCTYPVAIFHGLVNNCFGENAELVNILSTELNVYTRCIESGANMTTLVTSITHQSEQACKIVNSDQNFQGDFSIVGISQGGIIARYIIQHCNLSGRVKRFISLGGPQMGVIKPLDCSQWYCNLINSAGLFLVYNKLIQNHIGPAGYVRDVNNFKKYLKYSSLLADLNNEREEKNQNYKQRFLQLERIVLIQFGQDQTIYPKESEWFQSLDTKGNLLKLEDSPFYSEDYIGLKQLNEEGKVQFIIIPKPHVIFDYNDIENYIIPALR
jgi:palmitoyl-protein thioesterase